MLYKNLKHDQKKHPVRVSNSVLGEFQEETGKDSLKKMNFRDIRILLWHSLKEGYEFADKEFNLTMKDVKLMVDDVNVVRDFLLMIPEFFPAADESAQEEGSEDEKKKSPPTTKK